MAAIIKYRPARFGAFGRSLAALSTAAAFRSLTGVRETLAAARTYYVRTDGSDSNTGLANTSGGAFLTIQKAIDVAAALDMSIYNVTIQVDAGTYTQGLSLRSFLGSGTITIRGDTTTPSNVVINPTSATCITADNVSGIWIIRGVKLTATTSGNGIVATGVSNVLPYEIEFGSFAAGNIHMYAVRGGIIYPQLAYTITGGGSSHMYGDTGGMVINNSKTITVSGTFSYSFFARVRLAGIIQAQALTFTGTYTVTGSRYLGQLNGVIDVAGGGASYFPGDSAGSTATGAQYA